MALTAGTRLGPYEITAQIGFGGMGQVYRARDTKLDRDVAIKVLPEAFAHDAERLARFLREAKTLASLNHPNIAAIYGLEDADGIKALVMELVEGDDLSQRIARGAIPIDDALPIAKQIAEALEAAHEQGIIHRDLKPANIKVRADGIVKVLDFGLAKAMEPVGAMSPSVSQAQTITSPMIMTGVGMILGTAAYMSPEQARGNPVDRRADIWAFGCVLYEMLTGRRAFPGEDVTDTLANVLKREPDWSRLPPEVSAPIRTLLTRCLEKEVRRRVSDVAVALFVIGDVYSLTGASGESPRRVAPLALWRRALPYAAVAAVAAVVYGAGAFSPRPTAGMVTRFAVSLPEREQFINRFRRLVALSPDGTLLAYVAGNRIHVRALDALHAVPIQGTEGLGDVSPREVFFSPDGEWIGFFADGRLKKVPVSGGVPVTLCVAQAPEGASWERDNTIFFGQEKGGIWRVSGDGGTPELIVKVDPNQRAHGPTLLPDGKTILFTLTESFTNWNDAQIVVHSLETGVRRTLINGGTDARYLPTGHLVYALRGALLAVPFDVDSLRINGSAVSVVENVWKPGPTTGTAQFAVSAGGTLAFIPGVGQQTTQRTLVWVDRQGGEEPIVAPPRAYVYPRISPDGSRIALDVPDDNRDIWVWTLARHTLTRLTFDPAQDLSPVWTPDGQRIIFASERSGARNLFWQPASGAGEPEQLTHSDEDVVANTVSTDGTRAVGRRGAGTGSDITMVTLGGNYQVEPLLDTKFTEQNPEISPEGRWIAYESNATGTPEIYVRPFPGVGSGQWQISTTGGEEPLWARNGRELFYRDLEGAIMQVPVETGRTFSAGTPTKILEGRYYAGDSNVYVFRTYDISPDGRRFLVIRETEQAATTEPPIIVVQQWFEELKRLVPTN